MEKYESNSHKSKETISVEKPKEAEKRTEKIVSGKVVSKKKSEVRKFASIFIADDISNVKSFILKDVLVPNIKRVISDVITNSIDMLLYGEVSSRKTGTNASKVSYNSYYKGDKEQRRTPSASTYDYDDIVLTNRGEAESVLTRMDELIDQYGIVSVADLYDLVGITCNYTDFNYGWTDLRSSSVGTVRDGYLLKLPKAISLK